MKGSYSRSLTAVPLPKLHSIKDLCGTRGTTMTFLEFAAGSRVWWPVTVRSGMVANYLQEKTVVSE